MTTLPGQTNIGFAHFIGQSDTVGKVLLVILILMSVVTWYVILNRLLAARGLKSSMQKALDAMNAATSATSLKDIAQGGDAPMRDLFSA